MSGEVVRENLPVSGKLYTKTLKSGLKCYIIPRQGYAEKRVMCCARFGSLDNTFTLDGVRHEMPPGIAHFLEHKLFEDEELDVFDHFSRLGADINAFTNFTTTAYYFTIAEDNPGAFAKCVELLTNLIQRPYFTEKNVEKEKRIIEQEISMYDDDPGWMVYFNMLQAAHKGHPAGESIAGTAQSVGDITKDMLYTCYDAFYTPGNMALICVGDIDREALYELVDRLVPPKPGHDIARGVEPDTGGVSHAFVSRRMSVSRPIFQIAFKERDFYTPLPAKWAASKLLMELAAGDGAETYAGLFRDGLIGDGFGNEYLGNQYFGSSILGGLSERPQLAHERILEALRRVGGAEPADLERVRNKLIGRLKRRFNSVGALAAAQADAFSTGGDFIGMCDALSSITMAEVLGRLGHFSADGAVLSVIEG